MVIIRATSIATLLAMCMLTAATADQDGNGDVPLKDLVERLTSRDVTIRKEAAKALKTRSNGAYAGLGGHLGLYIDEDLATMDRFRNEAKPLVAPLVKLLQCPHEESRAGAAFALGALGPAAEKCRPALREVALDRKNSRGLRMVAIPALLNVIPPNEVAGREFVEWFIGAFCDDADDGDEPDGRESKGNDDETVETVAGWSGPFLAALLIGAGRTTIEVPSLVEAMQVESPRRLRMTAITALATLEVESRRALPMLRKLLADDDRLVRLYAGLALVHINADRAEIPVIIKAMALDKRESAKFQDEASSFLAQKSEQLKRVRDGGVELAGLAVHMLKHRNSFHQRQAIRTLGEIGPAAEEAIPKLTELLKSEDKDTRAAAAEALKAIRATAGPPANEPDKSKAD